MNILPAFSWISLIWVFRTSDLEKCLPQMKQEIPESIQYILIEAFKAEYCVTFNSNYELNSLKCWIIQPSNFLNASVNSVHMSFQSIQAFSRFLTEGAKECFASIIMHVPDVSFENICSCITLSTMVTSIPCWMQEFT